MNQKSVFTDEMLYFSLIAGFVIIVCFAISTIRSCVHEKAVLQHETLKLCIEKTSDPANCQDAAFNGWKSQK